MTERELQDAVIEMARLFGWRVAHFRVALTKRGWRTPVAADGAGFPDLVLVRDRVIYAELKGDGGRIRPDQQEWRDALLEAGEEVYLWRPDDWTTGRIDAVLAARRDPVGGHLSTPRAREADHELRQELRKELDP